MKSEGTRSKECTEFHGCEPDILRYATNPALGEKPVAGFVVKWAILDSNQ